MRVRTSREKYGVERIDGRENKPKKEVEKEVEEQQRKSARIGSKKKSDRERGDDKKHENLVKIEA